MRYASRLVLSALTAAWLTWACGSSNSGTNDGSNNGLAGDAGERSGLGGDVGSGATSSKGGSAANGGSRANAGGADGLGGDGAGLAGDTGIDGGGDGNTIGGAGSDPGLPMCTAVGVACVQSHDCCSGVCDPKTNKCASVVGVCTAEGLSCKAGPDCCSFQCGADGKCAKLACVSDSGKCTASTQCCGGSCTNGSCAALNPSCKTAGNGCATAADCCSGQCGANKTCTLGGSYCIQPGDVCARSTDCCTGNCTIAGGAKLGTCAEQPSGPAFCTGVDGVTCGGCGDCCSRLCAPFGPTGVKICQPANGCHVTGDLCRRNQDCCGGTDDETLPGYGNVVCDIEPGAEVGLCRNPSNGPGPGGACNPQGNVCHYKGYMCDISSARADCCGGLGAKGGVCQLDPLGIPRCNGLGNTCRKGGDTCASTDDCCNNTACVPDLDGVLRCGSGACEKSGGSCTINADCCPGSVCLRAPGSTIGTCGGDTGGGGSGGSSGSGGAGTGGSTGASGSTGSGGTTGAGGGASSCSEYGQICKSGGDCCNAVPCTTGICRYPTG
jgi:hypothetical protein